MFPWLESIPEQITTLEDAKLLATNYINSLGAADHQRLFQTTNLDMESILNRMGHHCDFFDETMIRLGGPLPRSEALAMVAELVEFIFA